MYYLKIDYSFYCAYYIQFLFIIIITMTDRHNKDQINAIDPYYLNVEFKGFILILHNYGIIISTPNKM